MFERFTDRARRVVVLAGEEAKSLNHDYIGTEHILLGLIHEGEGIAGQMLLKAGIDLDKARGLLQKGEHPVTGHITFTPRAKRVIEVALREALQLNENFIATEHILLALIQEGDDTRGVQVIAECGVDPDDLKMMVLQRLAGYAAYPVAHEPADLPNVEPNRVHFISTENKGIEVHVPDGAEITRVSVVVRFPGSKRKRRFEINLEEIGTA